MQVVDDRFDASGAADYYILYENCPTVSKIIDDYKEEKKCDNVTSELAQYLIRKELLCPVVPF